MNKIFFVCVLAIFVLSACSTPATSVSNPVESPELLPTDTPIPLTATLELSRTVAPVPEEPGSFEYASVTEALADLKTRDGVSIEVLQGWTIVRAADGLTNWSFPPPDHPAYPAVAKRVLYRDQEGWHLKMDVLCEAETAACDQFVRYFEALNAPLYQYIEQHQ